MPGQKKMYAHNCYLQLWSETGLLGLVSFLIPFFWIFIRAGFRNQEKDQNAGLRDALQVGLFSFLIQSLNKIVPEDREGEKKKP